MVGDRRKVHGGFAITCCDGLPVKDPDENWGFGEFPQEPDWIFPIVKQMLTKEIPWGIQL